MDLRERIETLRTKLGEIADIESALSLSQWDQETHMPPKGAAARGLQQATLSAVAHRMFTADEMGGLLRELNEKASALTDDEAKLVEIALYDYERATRLPEAFVREFAEVRSAALGAWTEAREKSDFSLFKPFLEKLTGLLRRKCGYMGYEGSPYNALLEDYERGMTAEALKSLFARLAEAQGALAKSIAAVRQPDTAWLNREWDEKAQWDFSLRVLRDLGYDFDAGRQDRSAHPFTTHFDCRDVRITTRIDKNDPFSCLMSSIHECGHALYEQGIREEDRRTPLAQGISLGIHESQSRMWENTIGRSLAFWEHYLPIMRGYFPGALDDVELEAFYAALNRVRPSLIRVEADECTYNLHIIVRFEIETALIEGDIEPADAPAYWNGKIKEYLGIEVPDDARGCLQDIHWSHGLMGYFPTYALGNLYAAQMFERVERDIPDVWSRVRQGSFGELLNWLRENVHRHGRRKTAAGLVREISGRGPEAEPFLRYLETKYKPLYGM